MIVDKKSLFEERVYVNLPLYVKQDFPHDGVGVTMWLKGGLRAGRARMVGL